MVVSKRVTTLSTSHPKVMATTHRLVLVAQDLRLVDLLQMNLVALDLLLTVLGVQ